MACEPTIVVVDDDEHVLSAFADFLKREGVRMIAAPTMATAFVTIEHLPVDLLIVDLCVPVQLGLAFVHSVKTKHPALPIIAITGYTESVTRQEVRALGAEYFFAKPLDLDGLRNAVRKCLGFDSVQTLSHGGSRHG